MGDVKAAAERLRDAAWALDNLDRICRVLYEPVARGHAVDAGEVTVTVQLTDGDGPVDGDAAMKLLAWVGGDVMQRDLRAIADAVEAAGLDVPLPSPDTAGEG